MLSLDIASPRWVVTSKLGTSIGSSSISVGSAGLHETMAVRITVAASENAAVVSTGRLKRALFMLSSLDGFAGQPCDPRDHCGGEAKEDDACGPGRDEALGGVSAQQ